jgi:hypothetical protein
MLDRFEMYITLHMKIQQEKQNKQESGVRFENYL